MVENRMVLEAGRECAHGPEGVAEKLRGPGREEIGTGIFVAEEDAFDYALERCFEIVPACVGDLKWTQEFREMLVEWFYSGNWTKIPQD